MFLAGPPEVAHIAASLLPRYAVLWPPLLQPTFEALCELYHSTNTNATDDGGSRAVTARNAQSVLGGLVELLAGVTAGVRLGSLELDEAGDVSDRLASFIIEELGAEMLPRPRAEYSREEALHGGSTAPFFGPSDPYGYLWRAAAVSSAAMSERLLAAAAVSGFIVSPCAFLKAAFLGLAGSEQEQRASAHFLECILTTEFAEEPKHEEGAENGEPEEGEVGVNEPEANGVEPLDMSWVAAVLHPRPEVERWVVRAVRQSKAGAGAQWALLEKLVQALKSADASSLGVITEDEAQAGAPEFYSVEAAKGADEEKVVEGASAKVKVETQEADKTIGASEPKAAMAADHEPRIGPANGDGGLGGEKRAGEVPPLERRARSPSQDSQDSWANGRRGGRSEKGERAPKRRRYSSSDSEGGRQQVRSPPRKGEALRGVGQPSWYAEGDPKAFDVFPASRHLWVGSLVKGVNDDMLRQQFERYGPVEKATAIWSRQHGFIDFVKMHDAVRAREAMQGEPVWGHQRLAIRFSDGGRKKSPERGGAGSLAIWVGGIDSQRAKEDLLRDLKAGGVADARCVTVLLTASALLLEYEAPEDAAAAVVHIRAQRAQGLGA